MAHHLGLVHAMASDKYYTSKFSSTIIASLATSTPIIANDAFLQAYSFLDRSSVHYQAAGKQEVDVMLEVMASTPEEVAAVRQRVADVRTRLNERAKGLIEALITRVCAASKQQAPAAA